MKNLQRSTALIALTLIALAAGTATATEGVSPGALDRLSQVNNVCPTFSWGETEDTAVYELVAYVLPEDASQQEELTGDSEVLFTRVAGSATSWTPSFEKCFAPGGRYVWFVRAVMELVGGQVIEAGEWSAGRYFTVPAAPSHEEVARAVEILRQWEAANGGGSLVMSSAAATATDSGTGSGHFKSVPTASAAIRGEHPETSGEKYGVVGTTASLDGAGIAAANLEGGPDLVLDGSASGAPDAMISESVLERSSPSDQVFLFHNGGGGALDVVVHGSVTGDAVKVQYGTVIDDAGNWLGVGETVPCLGCVESSDIADGGVGTVDLADDAVTGAKIGDGTVDSYDLAPAAVTGTKLANGAVSAVNIRAGAVENTHLADDAVTGVEIQDGAVGNAHMADDSVTGVEILDGTITAADVVGGGLYSSKDQLYEREDSITFAVFNTSNEVIAACDDENDLPLSGSCYTSSNSTLVLKGFNNSNWNSASSEASLFCGFRNFAGGAGTGYARILCISVP